LLVGVVAAAVCSLYWPAVHFSDEYLPFGNDAFYHARRILDTVANPAAFYQFDPKIHAPEGSLLTWPWGYDYAMAWLVKGGLALGLATDPMAILIWLPVVAVFASIGLLMLIARRLSLSPGLIVIAGLAAALSPLTQYLHAVGQIDHHFAEYIFVLAMVACGLRWFARPDDAKHAIILGVVLGAAPNINNGLFILQVPLLATLLVLWLQGTRIPVRATLAFAGALLLTTLSILIPSLPFRLGLFEFYTLSWFHLYVAAGSAVVALALAALPRTPRNIG
jgi:asparagine N-glycosylation enzyme membrane subunit Stt3